VKVANGLDQQQENERLIDTLISTPKIDNGELIKMNELGMTSPTAKHYSSTVKKKQNKSNNLKLNQSKRRLRRSNYSFNSTNRFEVLEVEEENMVEKESIQIGMGPESSGRNTEKKIWICADSHGKDLSWYVNSQQDKHKAVGFVRPGAGSKQVIEMCNNLEELHKEDTLVLLCGTNDVAKNESQVLINGVSDILKRVNGTCKIVLVDLPT
ncbi:hypothetical protein J6590_107058, partial [Homalodisca vitripennis]